MSELTTAEMLLLGGGDRFDGQGRLLIGTDSGTWCGDGRTAYVLTGTPPA
jgi:hypothetical protein